MGMLIVFADATELYRLRAEHDRSTQELETAYEELQSTNAELQAVNLELQQRTDGLDAANTFFHSVLGSLQVGVVILDTGLAVKIWNPQAEELWRLRGDKVRGQRLFMNLDIGLPVQDLLGPIRACLSGEKPRQELVLEATNRRGRRLNCRVGCAPLVGTEQQIQGVILLMEEVKA